MAKARREAEPSCLLWLACECVLCKDGKDAKSGKGKSKGASATSEKGAPQKRWLAVE